MLISTKKKRCIVSLTSYRKRFSTLPLCLTSLFNQTLRFDKIILYLDSDESLDEIPPKVKAFTKYGLQIIQTGEALKSHTKYYYAMNDFRNDIIITVDDDVIYDAGRLEALFISYLRYPRAVSAGRVHNMTFEQDGKLKPYLDWEFECDTILNPSSQLFATGVGGVLYPPSLLPDITFNKELIKKYSLFTDDIWLKFMELINGIPVVYSGCHPQHPKQITGTREHGLFMYNKANGLNDRCIQELGKVFTELELNKEGLT